VRTRSRPDAMQPKLKENCEAKAKYYVARVIKTPYMNACDAA